MTWLALVFALELGVVPAEGWYLYASPAGNVVNSWTAYTSLEAEVRVAQYIGLGGWVRTDVKPFVVAGYWDPVWATYGAFARVVVGPVEVGWRHRCSHPIRTYAIWRHDTTLLEGGYEELYVRITGGM